MPQFHLHVKNQTGTWRRLSLKTTASCPFLPPRSENTHGTISFEVPKGGVVEYGGSKTSSSPPAGETFET